MTRQLKATGYLLALVAAAALSFLFGRYGAPGHGSVRHVSRVRDGDTIVLSGALPEISVAVIRLLGVGAPETNSRDPEEKNLAKEATEYLSSVLEQARGSVRVVAPSLHAEALNGDRLPAWVYLGSEAGRTLNEMILEAGLAKIEKPEPSGTEPQGMIARRLLNAQLHAAQTGQGMWANKKGVFVGGIIYWGETEVVALVNRGELSYSIEDLVLRDRELEENGARSTLAGDLRSLLPPRGDWLLSYALDVALSGVSGAESDGTVAIVAPGGILYAYKTRQGNDSVWNDTGDKAYLYQISDSRLTLADTYEYPYTTR